MNIQSAICSNCSKETIAVWAANPPEKKMLFCPDCFHPIQVKQGGINFPYSVYLGQPVIRDGIWCDQSSTSFVTISQFIAGCLGKPDGSASKIPTSDHSTLDTLLIRLYDFVTDSTEIPYWRVKIENAGKIMKRMSPKGKQHLMELQGDIHFWQSRVEEALVPGASQIAPKQIALVQHLKACLKAWKLGEPPPKSPTIILEVNWELLEPDGSGMWERILKYQDNLENSSGREMDTGRLKLLHDQNPDLIFVGRSKFDGYVVFVFSRADVAFLDSAFLGNALYVMKASEWKNLSKLSKTELMSNPCNDVQRVIHTSHWRICLHRLFCKHGMN